MARDTRTRLLDVGLDRFARHGLAAVTVTDLEERAGLRPGSGSFYRHFKSKEELFNAVVQREVERVRQAFEYTDLAVAADTDARVALTIELRRVLVALHRLDALAAIVARDHAALGPLVDEVDSTIHTGVDVNADLLADLMDAGAIPDRDARTLATVLASTLVGYHLTSTFFRAAPGDVAADEVVAMLVDLIVAP